LNAKLTSSHKIVTDPLEGCLSKHGGAQNFSPDLRKMPEFRSKILALLTWHVRILQ